MAGKPRSVVREPDDAIDLGEAKRNLAGALGTRLRNRIVSGVLPPGAKVSIDELRGEFGVSLSPLREALARLAAEGFLVTEDKRGFRVAEVSRANLMEVARLQVMLETMTLHDSIRHGGDTWEESVIVAFHRLERHERAGHKDGNGVDEWEEHHSRFHAALVSASRMSLALGMRESLHHFSARYRRLFLAAHPFDRDVPGEHRDLMDATLDKRPDEACMLLTAHIERTAENILQTLPEG